MMRRSFLKQIFDYITDDGDLLSRFIPCPTCGTKMYKYQNWKWNKLYSLDFSDEEKQSILESMDEVLNLFNSPQTKTNKLKIK